MFHERREMYCYIGATVDGQLFSVVCAKLVALIVCVVRI
jgi:hypothetical protein